MTVEEKIEVQKFCSAVFNTLFLILGFNIFGCAVWILWDKANFLAILNSEEVKIVAGGLFIIGLVVMFMSILGYAGTQAESRFLLLVYMGLIIALVLGQVFISVVLVINRSKIERTLDETVDQMIVEYGNSTKLSTQEKLLDNVQHYGKCCGKTGPADWQMNTFVKNAQNLSDSVVLPCSCFNASKCPILPGYDTRLFGTGNNTNSTFEEGCGEKIADWLNENMLTIVGMDLSLMVIQVLQFVLAVYLYRSVGRKGELKRSSGLLEPQPHPNLICPQRDDPDQDGGYGAQNQGYMEEAQAYVDQDQGYAEDNNGYMGEYHQGYNHMFPEQNFDYPQPNQVMYDARY